MPDDVSVNPNLGRPGNRPRSGDSPFELGDEFQTLWGILGGDRRLVRQERRGGEVNANVDRHGYRLSIGKERRERA